MTSSNTFILGMMTAPAQVGFLNAASRLVIASRALVNPVAGAVYPHMSRLAVLSPVEAVRFLKRRLLWTAAPFLIISLGMFFFAPIAVKILYSDKFHESITLLRLMSPTPVVHALSMCFGTYFMLAFGYEKAWSRVVVQALAVNFILLFTLMRFMAPARSVALTTSLTDIFVAVSCLIFFVRKTRALEQHNVETTL
jgi:PST family polysaccharide transporter